MWHFNGVGRHSFFFEERPTNCLRHRTIQSQKPAVTAVRGPIGYLGSRAFMR